MSSVSDNVADIALIGAPRAVAIDAAALGEPHSADQALVRRLLAALELPVIFDDGHNRTITPDTVGIFGSSRAPEPGCYAWWVGAGTPPPPLHRTDGGGPRTTARILRLLGTGFAQERAGAAFRAAGAGLPAPASAPYPAAEILDGITRAFVPGINAARQFDMPSSGDIDALIDASMSALDTCCAPNGAIAAAPRSAPGEPDYWFFWQRDAAHVAVALHELSRHGSNAPIRLRAQDRAEAYLGFVARLGRTLGQDAIAASRCSMEGTPIGGYGDPQPDGPAATAIAIRTIAADQKRAKDAAAPYLEYLGRGQERGFDLWELTWGRSFHAANLARRALDKGAEELDAFRHAGRFLHVLEPQPPWFSKTSRLDMSVLGSVLFAWDSSDGFFDDPALVETLNAFPDAPGVGRFPEDCNDGLGSAGGNPWPVTTLWAAQFHLRKARRHPHDARHRRRALRHLGFVLANVDPAHIAEQIDAVTGAPRGARPLAWAHAELIITLLALKQSVAADRGPA